MSLDASAIVPNSLARCRALVGPALRDAVHSLHPWQARIAGYAFGWSDADGESREGAGGKGLRPALVVLCAEGVGARAESAIPAAVAVELVHAFSLIHDDIIDGDERRRHRDTVWKTYGVGPALLAGDGLLALAMRGLAAAPHGQQAVRHLSAALLELVYGQTDDVIFEGRDWTGGRAVTVEEYARMAGGKTGSLLACAAALGGTVGGAPSAVVDRLSEMGRQLGLALQIVDDLLGVWGDPAVTGKPTFSDLRQGKKTLPVVAALAGDSAAGRRLAELLAAGDDRWPLGGEAAEESLWRAASLIEEAGGREFAERRAGEHVERAMDIAGKVLVDAEAAGELQAFARYLIHRTV
ncbi:polyprenyl synthetase family protein [Streptosporangium sp. KLBMP 9127]|nr:polyprenyl synthetase family protein [Streptosporangium sp. KLBMP 9127]